MAKCEVVWLEYDDLLPESERSSAKQNEDWYIIECPKCKEEIGYNKTKLYLSKSLDYAYCHRCQRVFLERKEFNEYEAPEIRSVSMSEYINSVRCTDSLSTFPFMEEYFEASEDIDEKGLSYFKDKRNNNLLSRVYKDFGIRFTDDGLYIPFFFGGEAKYWTKRMYKPIGDIKYFLPPIKNKPFYHIKRPGKKFIICEGCFDAISISLIYPDFNVIGVMGSTITSAQLNSLKDLFPEALIIWLDDTQLSTKLKEKISPNIPYADIKVIPSNGLDPEEILLNRLNSM